MDKYFATGHRHARGYRTCGDGRGDAPETEQAAYKNGYCQELPTFEAHSCTPVMELNLLNNNVHMQ
jgi:hypothetical protein